MAASVNQHSINVNNKVRQSFTTPRAVTNRRSVQNTWWRPMLCGNVNSYTLGRYCDLVRQPLMKVLVPGSSFKSQQVVALSLEEFQVQGLLSSQQRSTVGRRGNGWSNITYRSLSAGVALEMRPTVGRWCSTIENRRRCHKERSRTRKSRWDLHVLFLSPQVEIPGLRLTRLFLTNLGDVTEFSTLNTCRDVSIIYSLLHWSSQNTRMSGRSCFSPFYMSVF